MEAGEEGAAEEEADEVLETTLQQAAISSLLTFSLLKSSLNHPHPQYSTGAIPDPRTSNAAAHVHFDLLGKFLCLVHACSC